MTLRQGWRTARVRPGTALAVVVAATLVALRLPDWIAIVTQPDLAAHPFGIDFELYRGAAAEWLAGKPFYLAHQVAGPYAVAHGDRLYPPPVLILLVPFTIIPSLLWWAIPAALVAASIWRLRPGPWSWPAIAFALWWPTTTVKVWTGNPVIWIAAALWVATIWRPAAVLAFLKPTLAPLALFGVRHRGWWAGLGVLAGVSLAFLPMWPAYISAVLNARTADGLAYSIGEVPMLLAPLAAWSVRRDRVRSPGEMADAPHRGEVPTGE
jgi:hypothetical protein